MRTLDVRVSLTGDPYKWLQTPQHDRVKPIEWMSSTGDTRASKPSMGARIPSRFKNASMDSAGTKGLHEPFKSSMTIHSDHFSYRHGIAQDIRLQPHRDPCAAQIP